MGGESGGLGERSEDEYQKAEDGVEGSGHSDATWMTEATASLPHCEQIRHPFACGSCVQASIARLAHPG